MDVINRRDILSKKGVFDAVHPQVGNILGCRDAGN